MTDSPNPTAPGRLIAVVGPSGVGKDTLMAALAARRPALSLVRRTITRAPGPGEPFTPVSETQFHTMARAGAFCLHWGAHGLFYGIPAATLSRIAAGEHLLVNLSRGTLAEAQALVPCLSVLSVTASPEVLAHRLRGRGRETAEDIAARLARSARPLPAGVPTIPLSNDGPLHQTVERALANLYPVPAPHAASPV